MKRAAILCFTDQGTLTAKRIFHALNDDYEVSIYRSGKEQKPAIGELFSKMNVMVFVGACGIAVRAIAPFLKSKTVDPAVIVVDELGLQAISLLSGHMGGANALTRRIASAINAIPIITTATDINRRFAVDEWAKQKGLTIDSMEKAKRFAVEVLKHDIPLYSEFPIHGNLPTGLFLKKDGVFGLIISCKEQTLFEDALTLIPPILHLGVGCKRGTPKDKIYRAVTETLEKEKIHIKAVASLASIDVKGDEAGLLEFCEHLKIPAHFYSAEVLKEVKGSFTASAFVYDTVGVDNVCERAAVYDAGENAELLIKKNCMDGVTVAVARENWSVSF